MLKKIITLSLAFVITLAGFAACSRTEKGSASRKLEVVSIAITPWPGSTAFYVALAQGLFREEGLDVAVQAYPSGNQSLAVLLDGKTDLATVADTPIARAAVEGKPVAVIATIAEIQRGILIIARKDHGISTANDLRGKKVGLHRGSTPEFFFHSYMTTSYIDPSDVRVVDLPPDGVVDALLEGEVDAICSWPPYTNILQDKLGKNALVLYDPNVFTMTWNIVTSQDFVRRYPERVIKFLRAIIKADRFILEHPEQARAIIAGYMDDENPLLEKEWENFHFVVKLDQSLILNLEDQARWMIKNDGEQGNKQPNFLNFVYTDGLKAVQPESVGIVGR